MSYRLLSLAVALLAFGTMDATPFDDAVGEIMTNNLTGRIEAARAQAGVESILGENTLEAPEAEFSHVWGKAENKWSFSISQSFDWPGVYAARREAARTARTASQYLMESTLLDLRQEVRTALIDIIHNARLIDMQRGLTERLDKMEAYYKKAAEAGSETRLDYNKSVIERIAAHRELHTLEAQREGLIASLRALNGGKDVDGLVSRLGDSYPIMPSPETLVSLEVIKERDPQYAAALASAEAARSMVKVERRSRIPGFSIGYEHENEGGESFNGFSFGITLPVWGRGHQVKAATLEADAAVMDAEMALARRVAEMNGDLKQLRSLRTTIDEYEPVINNKTNFQLLQKALDAGQINLLTYLQESSYFIAANRDYIDTVYEYNLTLIRLSRYQ